MKRLTVALLLFAIFASTVFAQSDEHAKKDRHRVIAGWLAMIKTAETKYKGKYGRYGDLADLRKAHLLDALVFESDSSAGTHSNVGANYVPKSALFQVTVSEHGQHFRAVVGVPTG
jgi:hypothetical protein